VAVLEDPSVSETTAITFLPLIVNSRRRFRFTTTRARHRRRHLYPRLARFYSPSLALDLSQPLSRPQCFRHSRCTKRSLTTTSEHSRRAALRLGSTRFQDYNKLGIIGSRVDGLPRGEALPRAGATPRNSASHLAPWSGKMSNLVFHEPILRRLAVTDS